MNDKIHVEKKLGAVKGFVSTFRDSQARCLLAMPCWRIRYSILDKVWTRLNDVVCILSETVESSFPSGESE